MTPMAHYNYRIGMPSAGTWVEIFNSDAESFWGSGVANTTPVHTEVLNWHGRETSASIIIPPLGAVVFKKV
jgi:1,4-alpha-glucan branching enzyme